ncbi:hypothetical protein L6R53_17585, partial [Myxococcota bacterium]|nr:hypothetical protein [Myxococcota bacterium]
MSRRCRPPMLPLALAWGAAAALPARAATDLTRLVQEPGSDPIAVVTRDLPTWLAAAATEVAVGPGAPTAFVALKDDGSGQDVMAADGIAVATFDVDPADADLTIALRSADGTVLWQDTVPPARGAPAVVLELWGQEDRLRVGVHIAMPESTVAPDGSAPPVGGAAAGTDPRGGPPGLPSMPAATHLASMALSGLL